MKAGILVTVCVFSHAALCSISLASPCPIGPPDSKGIRLIRQSPYFVSTFEAGPGGLLEHRIMERDGVRKEITSSYFHPLMVHKRIGAENTLEMRYADDGSALGDLKKIKVWGTTFDVFDRRGRISAGAFTITFKGESRVRLGKCSYKVWIVEERSDFVGINEPIIFIQSYSPELNLILKSQRQNSRGELAGVVEYDTIQEIP